jgi:hypothetical protein
MAGIGAYQPHGAANTTAWNAGVGGGISRSVSTWLLAGSLNGSYDSNTGASAGTRRRFLGVATASGDPYGWSLVNMLNLGFAVTDSPSFGSRRVIDARLSTQARRAGYTLQLNAGLTDDLSEALAPGSPPVGSVAPVDFNTQSRFVILSATMPTGGPLALSLTGRYVSFTSPGRGTQWESGAVLTASYAIGAFQLSLYDQLTQGGSATTSTGTQNLLFLSIARSFGR